MTDTHPAQLAYLTNPSNGVFVLNVQTENGALLRFAITRDQLFNINADSANILAGRREEA